MRLQGEPKSTAYMQKVWKRLWWDVWTGWKWVVYQRIPREGRTMVARLMESTALSPATQEGNSKRTMVSASTFISGENSPNLASQFSSSHISLVHFGLQSLRWSLEWVRLWASEPVHRPFKSSTSISSSLLSFSEATPTIFHSRILWGLLFQVLVLQAGEHTQIWDWDTSPLRWYLHGQDIPPNS